MSYYSHNETSLPMSTFAIWCRFVQSRDDRSRVFSRPLVGCTKQTFLKHQGVHNCSVQLYLMATVNFMWHHYSAIICTGCGKENASRSNSAYWGTRQSTACQHVIWTRFAFHFPPFPTFLLSFPLLVVILSYPEQGYNSATGHFVWQVRSPGTVYHWTFVRHRHYQRSKACSRHTWHIFTARVQKHLFRSLRFKYDPIFDPATSIFYNVD